MATITLKSSNGSGRTGKDLELSIVEWLADGRDPVRCSGAAPGERSPLGALARLTRPGEVRRLKTKALTARRLHQGRAWRRC